MSKTTTEPIAVGMHDLARYPGDKLSVAAMDCLLLKEVVVRRFDFRQDSLVLAVRRYTGGCSFVSWHRIITSDTPVATGGYTTLDTFGSGDYYYGSSLDKALERFNERVDEQLTRLERTVGDV